MTTRFRCSLGFANGAFTRALPQAYVDLPFWRYPNLVLRDGRQPTTPHSFTVPGKFHLVFELFFPIFFRLFSECRAAFDMLAPSRGIHPHLRPHSAAASLRAACAAIAYLGAMQVSHTSGRAAAFATHSISATASIELVAADRKDWAEDSSASTKSTSKLKRLPICFFFFFFFFFFFRSRAFPILWAIEPLFLVP